MEAYISRRRKNGANGTGLMRTQLELFRVHLDLSLLGIGAISPFIRPENAKRRGKREDEDEPEKPEQEDEEKEEEEEEEEEEAPKKRSNKRGGKK